MIEAVRGGFTAAEAECTRFLYHEAELLDDRCYDDWFGLLAPEIDYRIPTRTTRGRDGISEFSESSFLMIDDHDSMQRRVQRFRSEFAFAEDPPSRTRRVVGNVRVREDGDAFAVRSNLLLFRARLTAEPVLLAGERHDRIRRIDGELRLARRVVLLDHTVLPMENLAVFL